MSRLALLVIRLATPSADREWVLGDTVEEYEAKVRADGPAAPYFWLLREALRGRPGIEGQFVPCGLDHRVWT